MDNFAVLYYGTSAWGGYIRDLKYVLHQRHNPVYLRRATAIPTTSVLFLHRTQVLNTGVEHSSICAEVPCPRGFTKSILHHFPRTPIATHQQLLLYQGVTQIVVECLAGMANATEDPACLLQNTQ